MFVSALTFFFVNLAPGGPSSLMRFDVTAEQRETLIRNMGLDRPVPERYLAWLGAALHGDLGASLLTDEPVSRRIGDRLPNTLELVGAALALSLVLGIPMGVLQALRRNSWLDHVLTLVSALGLSIPVFWLGIVLILLFAVTLHALPSSGVASVGEDSFGDRLAHLLLPAIVLATTILPTIVRYTRSAMVEVLTQDYVRTATAKGLARRIVVYVHALRNALIPVVSAIGALVPRLLGGTVVTEAVFGWPGMGRLALEAANGRDYPLVVGVVVVVAVLAVLSSLVVDIAYTRLDPRVRLA
ncbi:MAG: ABC transporter permease [Chloroflexota bacterium]|nr:ABC transporter permease [Chloroflexota bacterium]